MAYYNNRIDVTLRADGNVGRLMANDDFVQGSTNRFLDVVVVDRGNKLLL